MSIIKTIFRNKWCPPRDPTHLSFNGRTILVTGSNTGLGEAAARKFAAQGASRLILAVRNLQKGVQAQKLVKESASDPNCQVDVWKLDMLDYDSIKAFSKKCDEELDQLDIAVLNAGVFKARYSLSNYGWEETLQVNTLSTSLLALLLLPKLKKSKTSDHLPVLEIVSSGRHLVATLPDSLKNDDSLKILPEFNSPENFSGDVAYKTSKLLLMFALKAVAREAQPDLARPPDVLVTSVCPGACQSELARDMDSLLYRLLKMIANALFLRTAEEGARTLVSGAALGQESHGKFWKNDDLSNGSELLSGDLGEKLSNKISAEVVDALAKDNVYTTRKLSKDFPAEQTSSIHKTESSSTIAR